MNHPVPGSLLEVNLEFRDEKVFVVILVRMDSICL